jgi:hypothetical protein
MPHDPIGDPQPEGMIVALLIAEEDRYCPPYVTLDCGKWPSQVRWTISMDNARCLRDCLSKCLEIYDA